MIKGVFKTRPSVFAGYCLLVFVVAIICCAVRVSPLLAERDDIVLGHEAVSVDWNERSYYNFNFVPLEKGIYTAFLTYQTGTDLEIYAKEWWESTGTVMHSSVIAYAVDNHQHFNIYVEGAEALCNFTICETEGAAQFRPIEIQLRLQYRTALTVSYYITRTLIPFFLLILAGALVFYFVQNEDKEKNIIIMLLIGITLVICIPAFAEHVYAANDTEFHMQRIARLSEALFYGDLQYRLTPGYFGEYGQPMGVFYGMVLMIPSAALYRLGMPLWQCYQAYIVQINLLTVLIGYYAFRRIADSRQGGLYGCAIYASSQWLFHRAYDTAAIGEFSAMPFMPLLVLGFYELFCDRFRESRRHLVIAYTLLINTHILTTLNASVVAFVLCLIGVREFIRNRRWYELLKTAILALLINLWILVPYADFVKNYDFHLNTYRNMTVAFQYSFLEVFTALGKAVFFALVLCLAVTAGETDTKKRKNLALFLVIACLPVFLATKYVPWDWIREAIPPVYAVTGARIQHAFRYLTVALPILVAACVYALRDTTSEPDRAHRAEWLRVFIICIVFISLSEAVDTSVRIVDNTKGRRVMNAVDLKGTLPGYGEVGSYFFLYSDIDPDAFSLKKTDKDIHVTGEAALTEVRRNGTTFDMEIDNTSTEAALLEFPIWYYNGFKARGSGGGLSVSDGTDHRVRVTVPAGYSGHLKVFFSGPWFWHLADLASAVSLTVFLLKGTRAGAALYAFVRKHAVAGRKDEKSADSAHESDESL